MLNVVYTRTIVPTGRYVAKVMAFGTDDPSKPSVLDDCEIEMRDWDHGVGIDENHEQAAHDLLLKIEQPCGYSITEEDTGVVGLRKWKVD